MSPFCWTYDFDGLFTMDVPIGSHYSDVAWCRPSGGLGCANEYWEDNAGDQIDGNEFVVYYFNNSLLVDGESNALQHTLNNLNTSYLYSINPKDGNLFVLTSDLEMTAIPPYLVCIASDDGSEVVAVGGRNLNDLKRYANSVNFI